MAVGRYPLLPRAASRSRTHPPYSKRFAGICPEKSTEGPELLPGVFVQAKWSAASFLKCQLEFQMHAIESEEIIEPG